MKNLFYYTYCTQTVVLNGKIYIAAGSANKGGEPEVTLVEATNF
jgi:hypothetical protein